MVISSVGIPMPPPPGMSQGYTGAIMLTYRLALEAFVLALGTTLIASVYPAWRASVSYTHLDVYKRQVELNPVRAGMVEAPGEYRWCSYRANALGEADKLVKPHREYLALGTTPESRQQAFRELFVTEIDDPAWLLIRTATQQGVLVGDGQFAKVIAHRLGQTLTVRPRGRPRKDKILLG